MAFELIENCRKPVTALDAIPPEGVRVRPRKLTVGKHKTPAQWIQLQLGAKLAKALCLTGENVGVALAFGTGKDAGKIAVGVHVKAGQFVAKRDRNGCYSISISEPTADGLFSLDFPLFAVVEADIQHEQGRAPLAIFKASDAMLAVD